MADVNLPSFSELGQMEFMSPMAFAQAQKQMALADQFQQQNLAKGQEELRAKALANMFDEQANPLRVNQLGLQNEGMGYENTTKRVQSETNAALQDDDIMAKRQKMLADLDDAKLRQFMTRAELEMTDPDPRVQQSGMKKIMMSKAEFDRRNKQQDELAKIAAQGQNSKDVANIHAGATLGAARISADSRTAAAAAKQKGVMDFDSALQSGKIGTDKLLAIATYNATQAQDPGEQALWTQRAQLLEKMANNKAGLYGKAGQPDLNSMGVQTVQPESAFQGRAPAAPAAKPPSTLADVSKMYPGVSPEKLKEAYKKKFGVDLK